MKTTILSAFLICSAIAAEPTESLQWKTTGGHSTEARAISATADTVTLELAGGRKVELPLERLVTEQRELVFEHFGITPPKEGDPVRSDAAPLEAEGMEHPLGKVSEPIESAPGSRYLLYLPKSLKKGRPAPLLHYNESSPVTADKMKMYIPACERFGWILAGSMDSKNGNSFEKNHELAAANVKHLKKNPLVDAERIYFTGGSGGGAMSWWNFSKLNATGTLPIIAYIHYKLSISKGHHFVVGGATDYNRYASAISVAKFGKDALYRAYPGGHARPKPAENWIIPEGVAWLTAKYLEENGRDAGLAGDRLDYEAAMMDWINEITETQPHLAYRLCGILQETYGVSGKNADILAKRSSELGAAPANLKFVEGLASLNEFGVKEMADAGGGSSFNKSIPAQSRKAEKLAEEYAGVPFVEQVFKELAQPTQGK